VPYEIILKPSAQKDLDLCQTGRSLEFQNASKIFPLIHDQLARRRYRISKDIEFGPEIIVFFMRSTMRTNLFSYIGLNTGEKFIDKLFHEMTYRSKGFKETGNQNVHRISFRS